VTNPRRIGTIAAVDLQVGDRGYLSDLGPKLLRFFTARDLLLRPLGNTVYVMPPYCIDEADLDAIYAAIEEACATLL
jgi:adenosylmethionine-8-amino-7-oxononanoate aminotransferase